MKRKIVFVLIVVLFMISPLVKAGLITYEFPAIFEKEYNFDDPYLAMDFDLGVTFSEISNVYVDWSGETTAGLATFYSINDPFLLDSGIYTLLGIDSSLHRVTVWGGELIYPDPEPFNCLSEFELLTGLSWSGLLDGQGTIIVGYMEQTLIDGYYIKHGSVALDNASLIVNGIVIPEPMTLFFLGIGTFPILYKRKRKINW